MIGHSASKVGTGILAGALIATMATGVTFAASKHPDAKACTNSHGVLRLLNGHGKCAKGFHKSTLGAQGPKGSKGAPGAPGAKGDIGPQGPGAMSSSVDTDVTTEVDGTTVTIDGLSVTAKCVPVASTLGAPLQQATLSLNDSNAYLVDGEALVHDSGLANGAEAGPANTKFTSGSDEITYETSGSSSVVSGALQAPGTADNEYLSSDLQVEAGARLFTINTYLYAEDFGVPAESCVADAIVTPSSP
jgi:hypothetical protein